MLDDKYTLSYLILSQQNKFQHYFCEDGIKKFKERKGMEIKEIEKI